MSFKIISINRELYIKINTTLTIAFFALSDSGTPEDLTLKGEMKGLLKAAPK